MRLWGALFAVLCVTGCNNRQQILLKYQLAIDPNAVYTVETAIGSLFAISGAVDQPLATGTEVAVDLAGHGVIAIPPS